MKRWRVFFAVILSLFLTAGMSFAGGKVQGPTQNGSIHHNNTTIVEGGGDITNTNTTDQVVDVVNNVATPTTVNTETNFGLNNDVEGGDAISLAGGGAGGAGGAGGTGVGYAIVDQSGNKTYSVNFPLSPGVAQSIAPDMYVPDTIHWNFRPPTFQFYTGETGSNTTEVEIVEKSGVFYNKPPEKCDWKGAVFLGKVLLEPTFDTPYERIAYIPVPGAAKPLSSEMMRMAGKHNGPAELEMFILDMAQKHCANIILNIGAGTRKDLEAFTTSKALGNAGSVAHAAETALGMTVTPGMGNGHGETITSSEYYRQFRMFQVPDDFDWKTLQVFVIQKPEEDKADTETAVDVKKVK